MKRTDRQPTARAEEIQDIAELIRVRGTVQGVGFRPTVWRLAHEFGLRGWVNNDGQGVLILVGGSAAAVAAFIDALPAHSPALARIEAIEHAPATERPEGNDFQIIASHAGSVHTGIAADAATCPACLAEIFDPLARRYRYPLTNCTHCGPRLSIIEAIPYDRAATTMRDFPLCDACAAEYADPGDRRFHAQPIACPSCGPRVWLQDVNGTPVNGETLSALDDIDAACTLIQRGHIVAIKGLGGFQLACDAGNDSAVARLRERKQRECKPFALMARELEVIKRFCSITEEEAQLLHSPAAPIVIMEANGQEPLATALAPGLTTLGFMLPNTPLHHLLLRRMTQPIVLTSGNLSDEPQCIDNADALIRLGGIADYFLMHDRGIVHRIDDSVVRSVAGAPRILRRARGYAPAPIRLPKGFETAPPVLAMGGELKNTFCLLREGEAILSHHIGDLADARCHADYLAAIQWYRQLFAHDTPAIAVDQHPDYLSRKAGRKMADERGLDFVEVQHHHAHIASCLAENGIALDAEPVIGVALDGLGYGADGALWGGEFFLADYRECKRQASFKPIALPGGERAIDEPWRTTYAHLMAAMNWERFTQHYRDLELYRFLAGKPRELLDGMMTKGINSPLASSCGRLFDAVAAAAGICRKRAMYEGQAAIEFEARTDKDALLNEKDDLAYPLTISRTDADDLLCVEPQAMWRALLDDLLRKTPTPLIAARFHKGLAKVIVRTVEKLSRNGAIKTIALSGGVFQNRILLEQVVLRLKKQGFKILTHRRVPANDGGIALGQAAIAAARLRSH